MNSISQRNTGLIKRFAHRFLSNLMLILCLVATGCGSIEISDSHSVLVLRDVVVVDVDRGEIRRGQSIVIADGFIQAVDEAIIGLAEFTKIHAQLATADLGVVIRRAKLRRYP